MAPEIITAEEPLLRRRDVFKAENPHRGENLDNKSAEAEKQFGIIDEWEPEKKVKELSETARDIAHATNNLTKPTDGKFQGQSTNISFYSMIKFLDASRMFPTIIH